MQFHAVLQRQLHVSAKAAQTTVQTAFVPGKRSFELAIKEHAAEIIHGDHPSKRLEQLA
jgi:hypothetical protein